ncbi:hypothetical protein [Streptomyces sudanensis]|uniref:hypothetical protein n=1 Tax=Streptomyces sudanensis TaxID=436397 RepID=UPI0020CC53EA|nr:hypothetical protein [Streptomyces sudanensis]MCP9956330.1 hypothetical protein [Streptomyces sudanensis]MCQ0003052.1 hypothetical protein [Streptomyces sudanensis]
MGPAPTAYADPYWNKSKKCEQKGGDGRVVPTRFGDGELGWNHFSGKHGIKKCKVVNGPLDGKPDKVSGARLEYRGHAVNGGRQVKIAVVVQCAQRTADRRYSAGTGQKIGVVTAYCRGVSTCPNRVNE